MNDRRSVPIHPSNLQLFGKVGQNFAAGFRNHHYVFLTRTAHARIVQAWFDCEHLTIFQNDLLQARMLVDFQAKSVACAVKKSDAAPITHLRWKTATGEEFLDRFVNSHAINTGLDSLQRERLARFDRFPKFFLRFTRAAPQYRPSHVTEVPGLRVARENIEDD